MQLEHLSATRVWLGRTVVQTQPFAFHALRVITVCKARLIAQPVGLATSAAQTRPARVPGVRWEHSTANHQRQRAPPAPTRYLPIQCIQAVLPPITARVLVLGVTFLQKAGAASSVPPEHTLWSVKAAVLFALNPLCSNKWGF